MEAESALPEAQLLERLDWPLRASISSVTVTLSSLPQAETSCAASHQVKLSERHPAVVTSVMPDEKDSEAKS